MRIQDFGIIDDPVTLFGGPYSNLAAMEAMAAVIGEGAAICTGDVIGYAAEPMETVNLMRALGTPLVAGNCERQLARGAETCGCGFEAGTRCDSLSAAWYAHARANIDSDALNWMADLPGIGTFSHHGRRFAVIHGGATDVSRFLWPNSPDALFLEEITALEQRLGAINAIVSGHSGLAFHRWIDGYQWINAGAIGLPPHDGRRETRYGVLADGDVIFERLSYDADRTVAAMEAAELTDGYERTIQSGYWPCEEVLPAELRL